MTPRSLSAKNNRHLFRKAAVDEYCVRHAGSHLFQVVQKRSVQLLHTLQHITQNKKWCFASASVSKRVQIEFKFFF
jgi:hypothetical protein